MSLTAFTALCILGLDVVIYAFFRWIYGDKRSAVARQLAACKNTPKERSSPTPLVASEKDALRSQKPPHAVGDKVAKSKPTETRPRGSYKEQPA